MTTNRPAARLTTYQRIALLDQASSEDWGAVVDERRVGNSIVFSFENGRQHAVRLLIEDDDHSGPERPRASYTIAPAPERQPFAGSRPVPGDIDRLEAEREDGGMGVFDG